MKKRIIQFAALTLAGSLGIAQAKTITVNNSDNANFNPGVINLVTAINSLADGDTIAFNITNVAPNGVHYLLTPAGGYPLITNNSITLDGYTQPGAAPNTNSIHAANTARLKIVLSSTNGNGMAIVAKAAAAAGYAGFAHPGFNANDYPMLGFFRGTNHWIKGFAFQSSTDGDVGGTPGPLFGIAFMGDEPGKEPWPRANGGKWHISGCWFGLDPVTGQPVYTADGNLASPRHGVDTERNRNEPVTTVNYPDTGTFGVAANSSNPRAEFNVILSGWAMNLVGANTRISGNFFNVLPDGMHNFDVERAANALAWIGDAFIEIGRQPDNTLIGTDGDGVNDAEEGNLFGGTSANPNMVFGKPNYYFIDFYYGPSPSNPSGGTNMVIAGNYFGVAVDGVTRFTNACVVVHSFAGGSPASTVRFGSDFDGVSDALEANILCNNYPFGTQYPDPGGAQFTPQSVFDGTATGVGGMNAGVRMSFRGNVTIGNDLLPYKYANGAGTLQTPFLNYCTPYMSTAGSLVPVLTTYNTSPVLTGTFPVGVGAYTTVVLDVYDLDTEGWANGQLFTESELLDGSGFYGGFPQGKKYLGSYTVPNTGSFSITLPPNSGAVTVTASYSADPVGTHNGRVHTSNFSNPGYMVPGGVTVVSVADDGVNMGAAGTLYNALTNAPTGNTIVFRIPGAGPHYLQVPPDGFPLIYRKHNLVIDGYSQPGSKPNSNPITAPNNAVIQIVIDGRAGGSRNMAYETYDGTPATSDPVIDNTSMSTERSGYGSDERALLGIYRSTNVTVRGLAFLGTLTPTAGGTEKGICLAHDYGLVTNGTTAFDYLDSSDAYTHISGCWFGVNPTNQTVSGVEQSGIAVTAYRHRGRSSGDTRPELPNIGLNIGVAKGSADPRAEFNVFVGLGYGYDGEQIRSRFSGNFWGVMPDGVTPYNTTELQPLNWGGGQFEFGRYADTEPMIVGTDGDGVNDADEGNLFGPLAPVGGITPQTQIDVYGMARKPWIIAGNRFGIAVDGTVWTNNSFTLANLSLDSGVQVRFGSDFNGVSDDLEANVVYNNNTFSVLHPVPAGDAAPSLIRAVNNAAATDAWLSARGNKLVNSFPLYNPNDPTAAKYVNSWSNYIANPTDTIDVPAETVPVLSASTISVLNGTCGQPTNSYTNLIVDLYLPDTQGQVNGAAFNILFFGGTTGAGFVNGATHLGAFLDNGPYDSNPAVGAFSFNIAGLGLAHGTKVTATVTYSRFARPVITGFAHSGVTTTLTWTGDNGGPFNTPGQGGASSGFGVQSASSLNGPWTTTFAAGHSATVSGLGSAGYYRIVAPLSGMTTLGAIPVTLP